MGAYLNSKRPYTLFKSETVKPYFVDKSTILKELFPLIQEGNNYICLTRPRRFGKTVMANLIGAFLSKAQSSEDLFDALAIARDPLYRHYLNRHDVIYISFNEAPADCNHYARYIERIQRRLIRDLKAAYPQCDIDEDEAVWDALTDIYETQSDVRFVFILDEWDYLFHQDFATDEDKGQFIAFLSHLLKDKPYVSLAYMTGILPIAKYSSGSELNMFVEFTMAAEAKFSDYFGFTEREVDVLYQRYLSRTVEPKVTRDGLRTWYDGYHTRSGERVYNPRSVVVSLSNDNLGNYWTSAGPYDEIFYYIEKNVDEVRDDLASMVAGEAVPAKVREYAATSTNLQTKDEIFSAMVVYGFLSYENGKVSIPNKELMEKFADMQAPPV